MNTIRIPWFIYPVALAFSLAWLVTGYITYSHTPVVSEIVKLGSKRSDSAKGTDFALINEKNIFSLKTASASSLASLSSDVFVTEEGESINTPPPRNIQLIGIMLGHGQESYAFLDLDSEKTLFLVGETISGVKLESVDKTSATILTSKGRTKLELYSEGSKLPSAIAQPAKTSSATPANVNKEDDDFYENTVADTSPTEKLTMTRADFVTKIGDINGIIKSVLMRPYEKDGEVIGYRLSRMTQDSVLRSLGLRNGDAIMRINGSELKSPEILFGMLGSVENISAVTLDLERGGQRKTIFVEIN